ncbi:MAG TPA: hypothetical protein VGO40_08195 [Longimicrobium sp.]|nr:hypothetical protein [Longimicrobium sp.]
MARIAAAVDFEVHAIRWVGIWRTSERDVAGRRHRSVGLESAQADFGPFQRRVSNPTYTYTTVGVFQPGRVSIAAVSNPGEAKFLRPPGKPRRAMPPLQNRGIAAHPRIAYNRPIRAETLLPRTR